LSGSTIKYQAKVEAQLDLNKGDYVEVFLASGSDTNYNIINVQPYDTVFTGRKVEGGGGSCRSESKALLHAESNNNGSVTAAAPYVYEDVVYDKLGAYNNSTGVYTVQRSGTIKVFASISTQSVAYTAGNTLDIRIEQNGTDVKGAYNIAQVTASYSLYVETYVEIDVVKGDTIEVDITTPPTVNASANAIYNKFIISEV
jgi:hypothetical protein